jgi:Fe-S-cluster containining protein
MTISSATRRQLKVYQHIDRKAQVRARELGATCRKGCAACCDQFVLLTEPEGTVIAQVLLRLPEPGLHRVLSLLREAALHIQAEYRPGSQEQDRTYRERYFSERRPCPLLEDGLCSVYAARPYACRTYYVVTPPELCGSPSGTIVGVVDCNDLLLTQLRFAAEESGEICVGPLPQVVLWALAEACHDERGAHILSMAAGILTPAAWTRMAFGQQEASNGR